MEQNQQGPNRPRRGHFHRGRRGPDRRGGQNHEPRAAQPTEPQAGRTEHVDVEQIMRDIRARIAQRHGIDLSAAQIRELAARRLEAILDPRNFSPTLLEQLRAAAGDTRTSVPTTPPSAPPYTFEDSTLYESSRGLLTAVRRVLNPVLKLFFNPNPLIQALHTQVKINAELASRERERDQRQAEWNALHYELLKRVVTESSKLSLEVEALSLRVEALGGRVDFADRRVRVLEAQPVRPTRAVHDPVTTSPAAPARGVALPEETTIQQPPSEHTSPDGPRRRRRRRRGRRSGGPLGEGPYPSTQTPQEGGGGDDLEADEAEDQDGGDMEPVEETRGLAPASPSPESGREGEAENPQYGTRTSSDDPNEQ
jgi:hypothetical protein